MESRVDDHGKDAHCLLMLRAGALAASSIALAIVLTSCQGKHTTTRLNVAGQPGDVAREHEIERAERWLGYTTSERAAYRRGYRTCARQATRPSGNGGPPTIVLRFIKLHSSGRQADHAAASGCFDGLAGTPLRGSGFKS